MIEFQEKFNTLLEFKVMNMYNIFKADIVSFEQEFSENEFNFDNNMMNTKYALVNDKIKSTTIQLREFLTIHGIELKVRRKANSKAKNQAKKRGNENDQQKPSRDRNSQLSSQNNSVIKICSKCGFKSNDVGMKIHFKTCETQCSNDGVKAHKCELCGKLFSKNRRLKKHIQKVHESHKDYKCESCSKSFTAGGSLRNHIHAVHEGHKDYNCKSCGKSFSQSQDLKSHFTTVHEGQNDYKCETCGKSFSEAGYLEKHILKIHDGNKNYKCKYCGKSFSQTENLKLHIRIIHEGHKYYICESCSRPFSRPQNLNRHIMTCLFKHIHRIREDSKDYKCKYCSESFSQEGDWKSHIERTHGVTGLRQDQQHFDFTTSSFSNEDNKGIGEFKCQLCHSQFMTEKSLKIHRYQCKIMTEIKQEPLDEDQDDQDGRHDEVREIFQVKDPLDIKLEAELVINYEMTPSMEDPSPRFISNSNDNMDEEESSDLEVDRNGNNDKELEVDDSDSKSEELDPDDDNQDDSDFVLDNDSNEDMTEKSLEIDRYQFK